MTRRRPVTSAIVWRAEMRAALDHLARNPAERQRWIVAVMFGAAPRIFGNATGFLRVGLVLRCIPVAGPLPDIADHVVNAVTVRGISGHRRGPFEAVIAAVLEREMTLPGVGLMNSARSQLVAPGIFGAVQTAACCKFPLGFGRQILACPLSIGGGISVADMHNGMIVERLDITLRAIGMTPIGALEQSPPLAEVAEVDGMIGRREDEVRVS